MGYCVFTDHLAQGSLPITDELPRVDQAGTMRHFSLTTDIAAPPERVWEVMSAADKWHEWTPSVTSIKLLDGPMFTVGTRALIRQPKFPPALFTLIAIEPGKSFTWVSTAPGMRMIAHHTVEPIPNGSRVTLSLNLQGLLGGLFGRMTKNITERYLAYEGKGLKARSEDPKFFHNERP
jgi:uncharacterized protein YndB with AHSA1/START domain